MASLLRSIRITDIIFFVCACPGFASLGTSQYTLDTSGSHDESEHSNGYGLLSCLLNILTHLDGICSANAFGSCCCRCCCAFRQLDICRLFHLCRMLFSVMCVYFYSSIRTFHVKFDAFIHFLSYHHRHSFFFCVVFMLFSVVVVPSLLYSSCNVRTLIPEFPFYLLPL